MDIKTCDGIDIEVLPDCAKCKLTGKSPFDMEECPACNEFDQNSWVCQPGECVYYEEE